MPSVMRYFSTMKGLNRTIKNALNGNLTPRALVKYLLEEQGTSQAELARSVGVCRQTLYGVWRRPSPKMQKIIADAINVHPSEIWPDRYDKHGNPISKRGRPRVAKSNTKKINHQGSKNRSSKNISKNHLEMEF